MTQIGTITVIILLFVGAFIASMIIHLIYEEIEYRRWMKGRIYIPSRTADLAVIRLLAPGQAPRYMAFSLQNDIYTGLLRPKGKLSYKMEASWAGFSTEASRAPKVI